MELRAPQALEGAYRGEDNESQTSLPGEKTRMRLLLVSASVTEMVSAVRITIIIRLYISSAKCMHRRILFAIPSEETSECNTQTF